MAKKCSVDELASQINLIMSDYSTAAAADVKSAVRRTANSVKNQIKQNAPVKTGGYKSSWATKTISNTAYGMQITVYSKNRYQIAHLLEKGHANRNGGRTAAIRHIAPAEEAGKTKLLSEIKKALK